MSFFLTYITPFYWRRGLDKDGEEQRNIFGRLIGKVGAFDETVETFEVYTERLDLYFEANGDAEELLVPSFPSLIGAKTYG